MTKNRISTILPILGLFLMALLLASGAATAQQKQQNKKGKVVNVRGTLTADGVECQAFRGDDGQLYTLTGNLGGFQTGDEVRVRGRIAEVSTCQQGTTLVVESIKADKSQGKKKGGEEAQTLTITGTLTNEGVECQALRSTDGQLYTLTGDLGGFQVGDRVTVVGTKAEISTCQQGTTLTVQSIKKA